MKISFHAKRENNTKKDSKSEYYSDSDDDTAPTATLTESTYNSDSNNSIESQPEAVPKSAKTHIQRKQHE